MLLNDAVLVHWIHFDLILRLGAAALIGLLLGIDREVRGRAAVWAQGWSIGITRQWS